MRTVATYSIKGGVGKTAAAVNLGYEAARAGWRTLVWDLDPQGAATYSFRIKAKVKGGARGVVSGERDLDDAIRGTDFDGLDVVPGDFSFRHLDLILDEQKRPTRRLRKLLRPLAAEYDLVILDCPPSISLASEAVLEACDALLVPIVPTPLSLRTLDQLSAFVDEQGIDVTLLPFFSIVDRRRRIHQEVMASLPDRHTEMLTTVIPASSTIERVALERAPVATFAPRTAAARSFADLWLEVAERLGPDAAPPGAVPPTDRHDPKERP